MDATSKLLTKLTGLRNAAEYRRVYGKGQRFHSPYFSAFILPTVTNEARLGITTTRKVGKAVVRNRCKRRMREVFRHYQTESLQGIGYDLVINAKTELANADFSLVVQAFQQTLQRFQSFLERQERLRCADFDS
jgi:ribonuclease P protein component